MYPKYLPLDPRVGVAHIPLRRTFSLQQLETIRENDSQSKCRAGKLSPDGYIYSASGITEEMMIKNV